MNTPNDPELTKLRLQWRQADERHAEAQALADDMRDEAYELSIKVHKRADALGFCSICWKRKTECRCVPWAAGDAAPPSRK